MTLPSFLNSKKSKVVATGILITFFVIGGLYYYVSSNHSPNKPVKNPSTSPSVTSTASPLVSASESPTVSPSVEGTPILVEKQFSGLGVTFRYEYDPNKETVGTKVEGDKVFIGNASQPDAGGQYSAQYLEVFHKTPSDSISTTISKLILTGYSLSDCKVFVQSNLSGYPSTYEMAEMRGYDNKCPVNYITNENGRYFLMDTKHPDLLLFFQKGQISTFNWGTDLTIN